MSEGLSNTLIGLQRHIDRITVHQAKVLHEAERIRAWEGTGARHIADWLAGKTKSSRCRLMRQHSCMTRSPTHPTTPVPETVDHLRTKAAGRNPPS